MDILKRKVAQLKEKGPAMVLTIGILADLMELQVKVHSVSFRLVLAALAGGVMGFLFRQRAEASH